MRSAVMAELLSIRIREFLQQRGSGVAGDESIGQVGGYGFRNDVRTKNKTSRIPHAM